MNLSESQKLGVFQSRDHPEDPLLLGEFQMVLETHDVVAGLHQVFLPKLHHRMRPSSRDGILQTDRSHRSEAQRVAAATR